MKIHVKAKASEFKFATRMQVKDCFKQDEEYEVKCKILHISPRLLSNTYELRVDGNAGNISDFLDFLRLRGFKIKVL